MIDLRSDTFTIPDYEMRKVMASAPVGDDVFGEDPTVNGLQEYVADLLGKEAALYVPSGTMGNQISIGIQTNIGDEVIVETEAHIFQYEAGGPALLSGVQLRTLESEKGEIPLQKIKDSIRPDNIHAPKTALICLENTHNRHAGSILSLDYIKEVGALAREHGINLHCDGARLWNAAAVTGISPAEYAVEFDTLSVCFSNGLGAPVGSCVVGSKELIAKALRRRKVLGGAMRQAGIIASGALYALKNNFNILKLDHENAVKFAELLSESEYIGIDPKAVDTNIVIFRHSDKFDTQQIYDECMAAGVMIIPFGINTIRAVFYHQISTVDTIKAAGIVKDIFAKLA
ncbi:MAG: GntG family PLP-dependent aldolase [Candidatus Kapabacteria bacterium]|jgi:threonine aldolase|nr:GntG family PLP-dependent aldolase [Candidatus Kapabacteria bacterium]